ncbi:MAG: Sir2 family NAD-dependent protein deacetylase [Elusimicrobiota bacterium]
MRHLRRVPGPLEARVRERLRSSERPAAMTGAGAELNRSHEALARMEEVHPGWKLITQNVDGLHQRAGSRRVLELHGSIWRVRCTECGEEHEDRAVPLPISPSCRGCSGLVRPAVVWFGESLPGAVLDEALAAAQASDLFLVIGTSGAVSPPPRWPGWPSPAAPSCRARPATSSLC